MKSAKPASFTFDAKITLKKQRGSAQENLMSAGIEDRTDKKKCVLIPQRTGARPMVMGT